MYYSALIVAAGKGSRMNLGYNKVLYQFEDGETVLEKTMNLFLRDKNCRQLVVVMNEEDIEAFREDYLESKVIFVQGGERRQDSVIAGLKMISEAKVLIHDGARPYLDILAVERLLEVLESEKACLLMVNVKDTVKLVKDAYVVETLNREELRLAQTPQAFETALIRECYQRIIENNLEVTDDCQAVELMSEVAIRVVEGDYHNIKITTVEDIGG